MDINPADALKNIPPYLFAEMEKMESEKRRQGVDVISFGIGDPDLPTPEPIMDELKKAIVDDANHKYPASHGEPFFREAVAEWYKTRFNVDLDPEKNVVALIGSKEGLANIARAFVNSGELVLVPNPAYPVYANGATALCNAIEVAMPLLEENEFKPDFEKAYTKKIKMMYLNYPNNPTGAVADKNFLKNAVEFAESHSIIFCYDNAYSEMTYDGFIAPSMLEAEGALDVGIEFNSLSKTFNMTGDRIGFAVGNETLIAGLKKIKSQTDSGAPRYIQKTAAKALSSYTSNEQPAIVKKSLDVYKERRDVLVDGLEKLGFACNRPKGTFYLWLRCGGSSLAFSKKLLEAGVVVTPGIGFGKYGEGYARFALTQPKERIKEALERVEKLELPAADEAAE
jgi:LL-diaminopimelate aminotransferase